MQQVPSAVLGMAVMSYPLFVSSVVWMAAIGVCLTAGLWLWRDWAAERERIALQAERLSSPVV